MSAAEQFKDGVSERSGPKDWRGGLERRRARRGFRVGMSCSGMWQRYTINRVDWDQRLAQCEGFQWDAGNSAKIWDRHRVMPTECEELFFNRPLVVGSDEQHSAGEQRFYALGQSDSGRPMFVVFTIRGHLIRVISARDMSRKERRIFSRHEKGHS